MIDYLMTADEAKQKLVEGNMRSLKSDSVSISVSKDILRKFNSDGQAPYAIIVTCSDSRVIPEAIFDADIGDLFVIRVAGNVIDSHQLGSIEYAEEHLGSPIVVVLGHTNCGAINAVLAGEGGNYIDYIAYDIGMAIKEEKDPYKATVLNVKHSCDIIESSILIQKDEKEHGLKVLGAVYNLETGEVEFI
ncbi:MAG: carbonic anhydrase [Lachnospiraceae bacterium]|nr:carbonic anhydrase [Lachnospiraceae bacterium]